MDTEREGNCVTTWWYVIGAKGAVQYMSMHIRRVNLHIPMDLGIHAHASEGDDSAMPNCKVLGGPCHFSPSFKGAAEIYERYREDGEFDGIWRALEETYHDAFK